MAKKVVKKNKVKEKTTNYKKSAKSMPLSDLWITYQIVNGDYNSTAGSRNETAKGIIGSRYHEVKEELYRRIYGCNPFTVEVSEYTVEGETPEKVLSKSQKMFDQAKKRAQYGVSKNPKPEEDE